MSPESIILLKLIAYRRKDLADIEEFLDVCKDIDIVYLRDWALKLGIEDRLKVFLGTQT